jgi:hypothetical protein
MTDYYDLRTFMSRPVWIIVEKGQIRTDQSAVQIVLSDQAKGDEDKKSGAHHVRNAADSESLVVKIIRWAQGMSAR